MPTKHRRRAITETPSVQAALEELQNGMGSDRIELGELVVLGDFESVWLVPRGKL
jgi:hypothetical protein